MTPEFAAMLSARLNDFSSWRSDRAPLPGRLVKYEGLSFAEAIDVPAEELEEEVRGLVCEGYLVDWREHRSLVYLVAWEGTFDTTPWDRIYAETDLIDIDAPVGKLGNKES